MADNDQSHLEPQPDTPPQPKNLRSPAHTLAMSAMNTGVGARISGKDVFIHNGRNDQWNLERNGFTLLTGQPFAVSPDLIEEHPSVVGKPIILHMDTSGAEVLGADDATPEQKQFMPYYEDIGRAAKEAYPEAEYVVIGGHISFDAEVSRLSQITALLGVALRAGVTKLLAKIIPSLEASKSETNLKLPKFGALRDDPPHVDISAEDAAKRMLSSLNDAQPTSGHRLVLPDKILSGPGKERRLVSCNFWRNARTDAAIKSHHLTVMDTQSVAEEEMAQTKFKNYAIGGQEQHMMWRVKDEHKLVYFPDMTHDEILVFKQGEYSLRRDACSGYDVVPIAERHLNQVFHTAFSDPSAPKDAVPRKSIVCAGVQIIMQERNLANPVSKL